MVHLSILFDERPVVHSTVKFPLLFILITVLEVLIKMTKMKIQTKKHFCRLFHHFQFKALDIGVSNRYFVVNINEILMREAWVRSEVTNYSQSKFLAVWNTSNICLICLLMEFQFPLLISAVRLAPSYLSLQAFPAFGKFPEGHSSSRIY